MTTKKFFALIFLTTLTQSVFAGPNENLLKAIQEQDFKKAEQALNEEADVNYTYQNGYSPLLQATENKNTPIASLLLKRGATVDFQTRLGSTSLMFAASNNDLRTATLLINYKANVLLRQRDTTNFKGKIIKGETALEIAKRKAHLYMDTKGEAIVDPENFTDNEILQKSLEIAEQEQQKKISVATEIKDSRHDSAIDLFQEGQAAQNE